MVETIGILYTWSCGIVLRLEKKGGGDQFGLEAMVKALDFTLIKSGSH